MNTNCVRFLFFIYFSLACSLQSVIDYSKADIAAINLESNDSGLKKDLCLDLDNKHSLSFDSAYVSDVNDFSNIIFI